MREFDTGATRDDSTDKLDYEGHLCPLALQRYAQYMHEHREQTDGKIRASDNWQKGMPNEVFVKSMFRHFIDLWKMNRGYEALDQKDGHFISTQEALCAIIFNAFGLLHQLMKDQQGKPASLIETGLYQKDVPSSLCAPTPPFENISPPLQYGGNQ